jgi:3-oxoacyl-[acyl-carrier protein] reductase
VNYSRSEQEARDVVEKCIAAGGDDLLAQGNVADDKDCRALAQVALDKWGQIDALINNAGITKFASAPDLDALDAEDFQRIYAVNVIGADQMTRACVPAMKAQGMASIVNISSLSGVRASDHRLPISRPRAHSTQ